MERETEDEVVFWPLLPARAWGLPNWHQYSTVIGPPSAANQAGPVPESGFSGCYFRPPLCQRHWSLCQPPLHQNFLKSVSPRLTATIILQRTADARTAVRPRTLEILHCASSNLFCWVRMLRHLALLGFLSAPCGPDRPGSVPIWVAEEWNQAHRGWRRDAWFEMNAPPTANGANCCFGPETGVRPFFFLFP